ncbi:MAG: hypothetical protein EBR90_03740 [Actinobacteria bacterium]|nr:hypothetical protein [Actinomycetota bacterium]
MFAIPLTPKDRLQFDDSRMGRGGKPLSSVRNPPVTFMRDISWENRMTMKSTSKFRDLTNLSQVPFQNAPVDSRAAIIQIIREVWPDSLENRAIRIAERESNLRPRVVGIPNKCCYGLFQINYKWHKNWLPTIGITHPSQLLNPRNNAIAALEIYRRSGGWGPWQT